MCQLHPTLHTRSCHRKPGYPAGGPPAGIHNLSCRELPLLALGLKEQGEWSIYD